MTELFVPLEDSQYGDGVALDEYNGEISLVMARQGSDEKIYLKWGFPQSKDRTPIDKSIPWKVKIGDDKAEAVKILRRVIDALVGGSDGPESDLDVPF